MDKKKGKKRIFQKLKNRYRLIIYNDSTYQTVWSMQLSRLRVLTVGGMLSVFLVIVTTVIIAYTPLREYIPGYPSQEERRMIINNAILVDSLEAQLAIRDDYFQKIKAVVKGEIPDTYKDKMDSTVVSSKVKFSSYNHDSVFRKKLMEEQLNLSLQKGEKTGRNISQIHFFPPLKGIVSAPFNASEGHYAVDIIAQPNARVSSVLDGTVIFADYTINTGYVIYVQHEKNIISIYKHNSELLKTTGDKIKAGEAIAIMGNSGELSTGPHLHFELWNNGVAVNPEQYIEF
ncbi:MAG: M23 family metallopeptidase [Prolixibacteraceae bacterium]|jgi:murein DD-endopeptidase MepM/ murein hydrolase activator NlpD|nr:M23 family metallopeptidase [Prolixibacteraceae bacterium]